MADLTSPLASDRSFSGAERAGRDHEPIWDLIELLFFAYRDFIGDPDDVLAKLGFGRAHHRVLHFVNRNPGMKVAELLDILKITKQSLGRVLKQLIDQGYVVQKEGANDRRIRNLLSRFLLAEGYRVTTAETADDARAKLAGLRFDLLILDVMMPGETGFDLARDLRASSSVPIIMLTARDEAQSRIEGLTIGADDYVGKPFEPKELSLRIASILRRARPAAAPAVDIVQFGDFRFHIARGELQRGEEG